jgi:hypothetical protein
MFRFHAPVACTRRIPLECGMSRDGLLNVGVCQLPDGLLPDHPAWLDLVRRVEAERPHILLRSTSLPTKCSLPGAGHCAAIHHKPYFPREAGFFGDPAARPQRFAMTRMHCTRADRRGAIPRARSVSVVARIATEAQWRSHPVVPSWRGA